MRWKRRKSQQGNMLSEARLLSGMPFDIGNVRTINKCGTADVIHGDWTVSDVIVSYGVLEDFLVGTTKVSGESTGAVSSKHLTPCE